MKTSGTKESFSTLDWFDGLGSNHTVIKFRDQNVISPCGQWERVL